MSGSLYRLTFSGELLEGQHPAVVKKKLGALLKLTPERVEKLFCGDTLVIKKSVDKAAAARYQAAFKQAGGKLRVAQIAGAVPDAQSEAEPEARPNAAPESPEDQADFDLAATGSNLLEESQVVPDRNIDTSHLNIASAGSDILEDEHKRAPSEKSPDVSHIALSDDEFFPPSDRAALDALVIEDQNWELGSVGDDMLEEYPEITADIDLDAIDFDVAEPGSLMDQQSRESPPPPPDTTHISLKD